MHLIVKMANRCTFIVDPKDRRMEIRDDEKTVGNTMGLDPMVTLDAALVVR